MQVFPANFPAPQRAWGLAEVQNLRRLVPTFDRWHRKSSQANLRKTCDDLRSRLIRALYMHIINFLAQDHSTVILRNGEQSPSAIFRSSRAISPW